MSREGHIPLCSYLYEGNRVDAKSFPDSLTRIRERLAKLSVEVEEITLVYDKGNLSKANQRLVDQASFSYVASLVPTHHPELLQIPLDQYHVLSSKPLGELPVLRLQREIWGKQRTVLLFISTRQAGCLRTEPDISCVYVDLIGRQGWQGLEEERV